MGNAAMRKAHRVENPAQDDMLTNTESDQSESMDSLVRFYIFVYISACLICSFGEGAFCKVIVDIIEQT